MDSAVRARAAPNPDREFGESLLACTGAAHAVDAFYGGFARFATKATTLTANSSRNECVLEKARVVFKLDNPTVRRHKRELQWLYRLRDDAVHFDEKPHAPVQHHTGLFTAAEVAKWSSPAATRAVEALLTFMADCIAHPRDIPRLSAWLNMNLVQAVGSFLGEWHDGERRPPLPS